MIVSIPAIMHIGAGTSAEKGPECHKKRKLSPENKITVYGIPIATCAHCHKQFVTTSNYAYRDGTKKFCSWSCLSAEKYHKKESKNHGRK